MTTNIYYNAPGGLKYIAGTYHAFANNGLIPYEGTVDSGTNTALSNSRLVTNGTVFISAAQIYDDLVNASDHLPVVADFTIPMPSPLITHWSLAGTNLNLTVSNGITNTLYTLLMQTNIAAPLATWKVVATNTPTTGVFNFTATNVVNLATPQEFFMLEGK